MHTLTARNQQPILGISAVGGWYRVDVAIYDSPWIWVAERTERQGQWKRRNKLEIASYKESTEMGIVRPMDPEKDSNGWPVGRGRKTHLEPSTYFVQMKHPSPGTTAPESTATEKAFRSLKDESVLFMTAKEVAAIIRCSPRHISNLVKRKKLIRVSEDLAGDRLLIVKESVIQAFKNAQITITAG